MPTLSFVLTHIVNQSKLTMEHLAPSSGAQATDEEVYLFRANRNIPVVSFLPETYQLLYKLLAPFLSDSPHPVPERILDPVKLPRLMGRGLDLKERDPAGLFKNRVVVPWNTIHALVAWLDGRAGRRGGRARSALEKHLFPERFEQMAPPPTAFVPIKPIEPRALSSEELVALGINRLDTLFDLVLVAPQTIATVGEFGTSAIDGKNAEELIARLKDSDAPDTLWLIQDQLGYHAALLGPALGLEHQRLVGRSSIGFRLRTAPYSTLRQCRDLRTLLVQGDRLRDGRMILTTHADRPLGTLITLRRLLDLFGLDPAKKLQE